MRVLLVAATRPEVEGVAGQLGRFPRHQIECLITGVGMVPTAARLAAHLASGRWDLVLNLGICGSFDPDLPPGSAVHVVRECLPEVGAEDNGAFLTVQALNLVGDNEFPFTAGRLVNAAPPSNTALARLRVVDGITVNTVHGNAHSIAEVVGRFSPQVESMEGAAFMYACLVHGVSFAEVRAVSNLVEPRNRRAWKMADAIDSLSRTALEILEQA